MTRKRFIKLMMAQGYTRNQCERMANGSIKAGYSYRDTYTLANGVRRIWPKLYRCFEKTVSVFIQFVYQVSVFVAKLTEACVDLIHRAFSGIELPPKGKP